MKWIVKVLRAAAAFVRAAFYSLVVLWVLLYLFVRYHSAPSFESFLTDRLGVPVSIEAVLPQWPLQLAFRNINIGNRFSIKAAVVPLQLGPLMRKKEFLVDTVTIREPQCDLAGTGEMDGLSGLGGESSFSFPLKVDRLLIEDGRCFVRVPSYGGVVQIENIAGEFLPVFTGRQDGAVGRREFHLSAELTRLGQWPLRLPVTIDGWVDWPRRDLEVRLVLRDRSYDETLTLDLESRSNKLKGLGTISSRRRFDVPDEEGGTAGILRRVILRGRDSLDLGVTVDFSFETQLDSFDLEEIRFTGELIDGDSPAPGPAVPEKAAGSDSGNIDKEGI